MNEKFNKINSLMSVAAEEEFKKMTGNEESEFIDYVMNSYKLRPTELKLDSFGNVVDVLKPEKLKVSLTSSRLVYHSPFLSERYLQYRDCMRDFLFAGQKTIFSRPQYACSPLFYNINFLKDIYNGFYEKKPGEMFLGHGFLERRELLSNVWQTYFLNSNKENYKKAMIVSDYIFENFDMSKISIQLRDFKELNENNFNHFFDYISCKDNTFLIEDDFLKDDIYKSGFYKTIKKLANGSANFMQLKEISKNLLNNIFTLKEINGLWNNLQSKKEKKISLYSMLSPIDLSKKLPIDASEKILLMIKEIIDNDLTKTEVFMDHIIKQFLERTIINENVLLANKILMVLKADIVKNKNFEGNTLNVIKSYIRSNHSKKKNFDIEVVQTLIDLEFVKEKKDIDTIDKELKKLSDNKDMVKILSFFQKKQIEEVISLPVNEKELNNKKRL